MPHPNAPVTSESDPVVAVDVGGTTIKAAIMEPTTPPQVVTRPTPHGAEAVVSEVAGLVEELTRDAHVLGAGVVVPGIVDEKHGLGVRAANLGWEDAPLRRMLTDRLDVPVQLGHDVRAGALAEYTALRAPTESMAFIAIGTGIAMGLILGGRPWSAAGYAGEIGHADIGHSELCGCGKHGCYEAISSARAIAARYTALSGHDAEGAITVVQRLAADPVAQKVWAEAVEATAEAIEWVASTVAPEVIVIGGGLSEAGDDLMAPLRTAVESRLNVQRVPQLLRSQYGPLSALYGAALLARGQ